LNKTYYEKNKDKIKQKNRERYVKQPLKSKITLKCKITDNKSYYEQNKTILKQKRKERNMKKKDQLQDNTEVNNSEKSDTYLNDSMKTLTKFHKSLIRNITQCSIWLVWLTGVDENGEANNFLYKDIVIDRKIIKELPIDGFVDVRSIDFDKNNISEDSLDSELPDMGPKSESENFINENTVLTSFLPQRYRSKKEKDILVEEFLQNKNYELNLSSEPFNEFSTEYLASLAFPTLFPNTKGDPTNNATIRKIGNSVTESFSEKVKHLIKFAEKKND